MCTSLFQHLVKLIKWLALKAFVINQVSNATTFVIIFVFLYDIYQFSPYSFILKYDLKNPEWYSLKQEQSLHCKRLPLKITIKACYKGPKYCKFTRKRNKAKCAISLEKDQSKR